MNEWHQTDFYEEMTEFYHPGYRKRIWTTPSVDLRNENTVKMSSFKLAQLDESGKDSPNKSPIRKQNTQRLRQSCEEHAYKQAMPQYIDSPTRKMERVIETKKARR